MLYGKVVLSYTLMWLLSIFSQKNRTPGSMLKRKPKICLRTSQASVKIKRIDRERQYYCLKIFTVGRSSLQHNNTAEPLEPSGKVVQGNKTQVSMLVKTKNKNLSIAIMWKRL